MVGREGIEPPVPKRRMYSALDAIVHSTLELRVGGVIRTLDTQLRTLVLFL